MAEAKQTEEAATRAAIQQQMDKQYIISGSQVQSILRYLFTRP